jgi:Protein of unknown function (DUF1559)
MLSDYSGNGGDTSDAGGYNEGLTPVQLIDPRAARPVRHTGLIIGQDYNDRVVDKVLKNPLIGMKHVQDGSSHTLLLGEKFVPTNAYGGGAYGDNFAWTQGTAWEGVRYVWPWADGKTIVLQDRPIMSTPSARGEIPCNCWIFGSAHPGGFNTAFGDGSTHTIKFDIDVVVAQRLANRADGQVIEEGTF